MSDEHIAHPYPTEQEKQEIMYDTGIELRQLTNWFVNNRKRFWKPRVEKKLAALPPGAASYKKVYLPRTSSSNSLKARDGLRSAQISKPEEVTSSRRIPSRSTVGASSRKPAYIHDTDGAQSHTISSDGSWSDDSIGSGGSSDTFDAIAHQYLDSLANPYNMEAADTASGYARSEEVDVLVLRPEGAPGSTSTSSDGSSDSEQPLPTIRDVTIKKSASEDRVLATFKCSISYTIPYEIEHDKKKIQSRRDGEVLRAKKHYLKLYLATRGIHSASSPMEKDRASFDHTVSSSSCSSSVSSATSDTIAIAINAVSPPAANPAQVLTLSRSRRALTFGQDECDIKPRKRARTLSGSFLEGEEEWRALCKNAKGHFCESLPGLEEAAMMFGFSRQGYVSS